MSLKLLKIETVEELAHPSHSNVSEKETCPSQPQSIMQAGQYTGKKVKHLLFAGNWKMNRGLRPREFQFVGCAGKGANSYAVIHPLCFKDNLLKTAIYKIWKHPCIFLQQSIFKTFLGFDPQCFPDLFFLAVIALANVDSQPAHPNSKLRILPRQLHSTTKMGLIYALNCGDSVH